MNFRRFLLKLQLWRRLRIAKRREKRLLRQIDGQKGEFEAKLDTVKRFYEKRLAVERLKIESLHLSWSDRFLQLQKLLTVSHVTIGLDEKADHQLNPQPEKPIDPLRELTGDELAFYEDAKDGFFEFESDAGRSDAEIQALWDKDFKAMEIERAKTSIY